MSRLASDLLLLITPFGLLSAAFFLGEQPKFGVAFILVTLAAIIYVRPWQGHREAASDEKDPDVVEPADSAGLGKTGGPV